MSDVLLPVASVWQ